MALLDDLATYLAAQSTALTVGATGNLVKAINLDAAPVPDTLVSLHETQGVFGSYAFSTGAGAEVITERPRVQVYSRATAYQTARTNAQTVYTILNGISKNLPTSTGTSYFSIEAAGPPFSVGRDSADRFVVSVIFDIEKAP